MCRSEVPADYLDHPLLLNTEQLQLEMALSDGYQWYYEGRNGQHFVLSNTQSLLMRLPVIDNMNHLVHVIYASVDVLNTENHTIK